jgi:site-specific DNA-methyltransferase (adenine-specific)
MQKIEVVVRGKNIEIWRDEDGSFLIPENLNGFGTGLKPAFEPILLARKPLEGTIAENVLKHGTGGINIDGCRISADDEIICQSGEKVDTKCSEGYDRPNSTMFRTGKPKERGGPSNTQGRFPANFIHDGSDEVVSLFPDSKGQLVDVKGNEQSRTGQNGIYGTYGRTLFDKREEEIASAARFFYCAKASSKDRDEGLEDFDLQQASGLPLRKSGVENTGEELDGTNTFRETKRKNIHPTVKPVDLMQYLCRLITPPNGTILDPFMGSGSTGKAAMYEGFNFIGVELMEDHMAIAEARIKFAQKDAYEISIGIKKPKTPKKEESKEPETDLSTFFE